MAEKVLFFFSAIGIFNALLLAIYLFFKTNHSVENQFQRLLLLFLVVRVGVSCFHFFEVVSPAAIKLGLIANLLIGPAIFFLMTAVIDADKKVSKKSSYHFGFWLLLFAVAWFFLDFETWNWPIRYAIHTILTAYLAFTAFRYRGSLLMLFKRESLTGVKRRVVLVYFAVLLICAAFALSLVTSYIMGPLSFSIVFYLVLGYFLLNRGKERSTSSSKKIEQEEFDRLNQRLTTLMEEDKVYRNPYISLESLASQLAISRHLLSQLLNNNLNQNFYQYINNYRIQDACEMLRDNKPFSIEAIGYEVGFNSRSSFFSSFKKLKGMTPARYQEELESV